MRLAPLVVVVGVVLGACTDEATVDRCPRDLYSGVAAGPVVLRGDTADWAEGDEVPFLLGSQGGYMSTPRVEVDGALADGPTPCLRVTLEHRDPSGGTIYDEFRVHEVNLRFSRTIDGDLVTEPILDQLRWAPVPDGTPLEITATVRGETFAAVSTLRVLLVAAP